jgi:hypothetical protein
MSGQNECVTGCGRPTRDQRLLCDQETWELEKALGDLPALLDELHVTLTRQAVMGSGGGGGKVIGKVQPLPYDVRASEVLEQLRIVLVGWVRVIAEDHGHELPGDQLRSVARWLLTRINLLASHEAAEDIHREITDACASGNRAIDKVAERIFVGLCECGDWLYARPSSRLVQCRKCERSFDVAASREGLWEALGDRLMTIAEIVSWGVQLQYVAEKETKRVRNLLDQWVKRGRIVAHSVNRHGKGMFPFGETLTSAMSATRRPAA